MHILQNYKRRNSIIQSIYSLFYFLKIFEDENLICFLDAFPVTQGHCLVVPKYHCETLDQLPEDVASKILPLCSKITKAIKTCEGVTGVNLCQNNGKDAGQVVPHVHFHLIPRRGDDHLFTLPPNSKDMISADVANNILEQYKKSL